MAKIRDREWRDEHEDSNYPFEDRATLVSSLGQILLSGTFLDAAIYPSGVEGTLFISQIVVTNTDITVILATEQIEEVCRGTFALDALPDEVRLTDPFGRSAGVLVSDALHLSVFQAWPTGTHEFGIDAAPFVAAVVFATPGNYVQGFLLDDGSVVSGEVWLVGGLGVILSHRQHIDDQGRVFEVVRADAIGDALFKRRLCSPGLFQTPRFLKKVVVQKGGRKHTLLPNDFGDVQITVGSQLAPSTILRVYPDQAGITFETVGEQLQDVQ